MTLSLDRTEELRAALEDAPRGSEVLMILDANEFVASPTSRHRVYGPASLYVRQYADYLDMQARMHGKLPPKPLPSAEAVQ